ncbi:unnamed protein product [marine sediment metagenome]|uniref:Uncharacterized protein n=1 Tax=marine sediment metagenome TaxID=412755 RepID=X1G072_9ZZZZ
MSFTAEVARNFVVRRGARKLRQEIEKAGLDALKILANNGVSIIATYLNGCSPQEKAAHKRDLIAAWQMGITPDMVLSELFRQMPELAPIMEGREGYKRSELEKLELFLKEA